MIEEANLVCPYCGETITVVVDKSAGDQNYVEDCSVCCQPIVVSLTISVDGEIGSIEAQPENV